MTSREREFGRALTEPDRTGDEELDALIDQADDLASHFAAAPPERPIGRALFIEGVAARRRSTLSILLAPAMATVALIVFVAVIGRSALPGEALYPVREVLRTAGLAEAPTIEIERELEDAALLVAKAQTSLDRGGKAVERFAVAALMSLGRAESYIADLDAADRVRYTARIDTLRTRAVSLIRLEATLQDDDSSGSGSGDDSADDDGSDDNSGSGSDDSGSDDSSGSGSGDDSADDDDSDDNSGSGSDDSGSDDSSGSGSGDDSADAAEDEADDLRDEQEDLADERDD